MADTKISAMPAATSVGDTDVVPVVQSGVNKKSAFSVIKEYMASFFGTFAGLSDTPSSYSGAGDKVVSVKSDESGLEFTTPATSGATRSITTLSDATSITPSTGSDTNINIQNNTQTAGTLTVNAPSSAAEARGLLLRIKCTNAQTLSFNAIYRSPSLLPLPGSIAAGKTAYTGFIYNSTDSKWDLTAVMKEY